MAIVNEEGIRNIAVAGNIIFEIFLQINKLDLAGMTTIDLNDRIDKMIRDRKGDPAFLNYRGFPKSACISINEEVVHGIPDERKIKSGDLIKIDVGVKYNGYIADAARTFPCGRVSREAQNLMTVTREALKKGTEQAKAGNRVSDISRAVQTTVEQGGYHVVRELTGHGVGRHLHEDPMIPNFVLDGPDPALKAGMVLAIEPMVNIGTYDVVTASNGWTIKSRDNSLSCHFEDSIAILERGSLNLTRVMEA
jgi:methionyl aminopeptidase